MKAASSRSARRARSTSSRRISSSPTSSAPPISLEAPSPRSAVGELKAHASEGVSKNATVIVSVRPEDVELSEQPPSAADGDNVCKGTVDAKDFLGDYLDFHVKVGDVVLLAKAHPSLRTPTGDSIYLRMKADKCVAIPGSEIRDR